MSVWKHTFFDLIVDIVNATGSKVVDDTLCIPAKLNKAVTLFHYFCAFLFYAALTD